MSNNLVKDWGEFNKLAELSTLAELVFVGEYLLFVQIYLRRIAYAGVISKYVKVEFFRKT